MTAPATQAASSTSTVWAIDPAHSLIEFSIKHLMIATVKGRFNNFSGTITFDPNDPTSASTEVTIDVASVNTGVDQRDTHLRTPDFFDVDQHPAMSFRSTRVEHVEEDDYRVYGDLTIRGISQQVTLDVTYEGQITDPRGMLRIGFAATTTLSRKASGLTYNAALETGGVALADRVKVEIHLEAVRQG